MTPRKRPKRSSQGAPAPTISASAYVWRVLSGVVTVKCAEAASKPAYMSHTDGRSGGCAVAPFFLISSYPPPKEIQNYLSPVDIRQEQVPSRVCSRMPATTLRRKKDRQSTVTRMDRPKLSTLADRPCSNLD